jgi:glycosyltransferase involved in cell wall biosynthesis
MSEIAVHTRTSVGDNGADRHDGSCGAPLARSPGGRPLRILHVMRAPIGGLLRHVTDLAREQARRGHAVGIVCAANGGQPRFEQMLAGTAPACSLGVTRLAMSRGPGLGDWSLMRRISTHASALAPDVIHGHGAKGGVYARLPRLWGVCPDAVRVYTPHGGTLHYGPGRPGHSLIMAAERLLATRTDAFAFESRYTEGLFRRQVGVPTGAAVRVVHNGLRGEEFGAIARPGPTVADFLYLGEMRRLKGVDVLLQASALVRSRTGREPRLALVGSGPDLTGFGALADQLGLRNAVFMPPMPARDAFVLAPVMVLPSRAESLPYVVLEAVAAQVDLIATQVGGLAEIVGTRADRLIPPGSPSALADAMEAALRESEEGRRDRTHALTALLTASFTVEHMAGAVLQLYDEVLAKKRNSVNVSW